MKQQILKIAGVKTEDEFYKKFPTEESFMAKCGGKFRKAQLGIQAQGFAGGFNPTTMGIDENFQLPVDLGQKAGIGDYMNAYGADAIGAIGGIAQGFSALKEQKNKRKQLTQQRMVTGVQLDASRTREEQPERSYVRPEDIQNTGEEFFPIYGVGTNPLAKNGKSIKYAQNGFTDFMGAGGTDVASKLIGGAFDNNAGYQTGAAVGNALKMIPGVGSVVGAVAAPVLGTIGGALDQAFGDAGKIKKEQSKIDRNIDNITGNQLGQNVQRQYNTYMEQGGKITPYAMGGELQMGKGGAETISYNPFLPDGGETIKFRGPSHANGGIPIAYGNTPIEVEGGEPAVKLQNGGEQDSLTVFGNLRIPKSFEEFDPKSKGKKFKNYVSDLSKIETKQNKLIENSSEQLQELNINTPFDKLKMNSLNANLTGGTMKLKSIADNKMKAAELQNAINTAAEQYGLKAEDLVKGKITKAKNKNNAQNGINIPTDEEIDLLEQEAKYANDMDLSGVPKYNTRPLEFSVIDNIGQIKNNSPIQNVEYNRSELMDAFNQVLPFIRPSDAEALNTNQLTGEMFALSNNQLEPVQAQGYRPQLDVPYDVSYQDQINDVTSQQRATERMLGYNPAVQANLAAQTYDAKSKILAEQFRMNQAKKDQVYSQNRNTMNDAQLKNLSIYDQQYGRQAQAKSNTKATTQTVLNSISSKYAQNELENRKLQAYENLYNYRYDGKGRAVNMNPFFQPNIDQLPIYSEDGEVVGYKAKPELATPGINPQAKYGKSITKNVANGNILKAMRNL